jgi:hypothetical protein
MKPKPDSHPQAIALLGGFLSPTDPVGGPLRSDTPLLSVGGGCEDSLVEDAAA